MDKTETEKQAIRIATLRNLARRGVVKIIVHEEYKKITYVTTNYGFVRSGKTPIEYINNPHLDYSEDNYVEGNIFVYDHLSCKWRHIAIDSIIGVSSRLAPDNAFKNEINGEPWTGCPMAGGLVWCRTSSGKYELASIREGCDGIHIHSNDELLNLAKAMASIDDPDLQLAMITNLIESFYRPLLKVSNGSCFRTSRTVAEHINDNIYNANLDGMI